MVTTVTVSLCDIQLSTCINTSGVGNSTEDCLLDIKNQRESVFIFCY